MLSLLLPLFKAIFGKRLADSTANYLNQRRHKRLTNGPDDKAVSSPLSSIPRQKIEPRIITITTPARWHLLSGGIIGAAITIIVGLLWQRRQ